MKKLFLAALLLLLGSLSTQAQVLLEDFEGGVSDLPWVGLNGTYDGVVANPDQSGINTSAFVGAYTNNPLFDFNFALADLTGGQTFDLSEYNRVKMKVWSPKAGKLLFKFETVGGGGQVEKIVDMTQTNQWVEYSFDLSGGVNIATLNRALVSFNSFVLDDNATYYFDDIQLVKNDLLFEDFESPSIFSWSSLNGEFTGTAPNPKPNSVNSSATVGCFVNNPAFDYNFAFGQASSTIDLSVYNQVHFQLLAPHPTEVLFKVEGGGQNKEVRLNIAVANAWQEYTVDFSSLAGATGLVNFLISYSPGVTGSMDTFYLDNIRGELNLCAGALSNPNIIDDFECDRHATYGIGWDSLHVVDNPFPTLDNSSAKVGQFNDPAGNGTEYAALVIDYENPIDLSVRNQFQVQVYSQKAGTLLLKIEGGVGQKEVPFQVTAADLNKWVTYTFDARSEIGKGHKRFVIFFNAGQNGAPGDVYYIDNIALVSPALEDFQGLNLNLGWIPLDLNTILHGTFNGPTDNPNPSGSNTSTKVGCYTKGSSPLSTLQAFSATAFDLSTNPQFNLDVYSTTGSGTVTMQLLSVSQGNKEATATYDTPGEWQTLAFNFEAFADVTDFFEMRLIFDGGTAAPGESWCIDNLNQGAVTTDPCVDVIPNINIIDDFECQQNFVQIYYGGADIKTVINPHPTSDNPSTKVGEYIDPQGGYAGIGFEFAASPDLTTYNQLQLQVWSPNANVPFLFKLEGGSTGQVEIRDTLEQAGVWYKFNIDFSGALGTDNKKLVIFVNEAFDPGGGTYYIDNIRWSRKAYNGCVLDFETPATTITAFNYFDQGSLTEPFTVVDNPKKDAVNPSDHVGKFIKPADGGMFTGIFTDLDAPVDFKGVKTMKAKVLMNHAGPFTFKIEQDKSGNNLGWTEIPVDNTVVDNWVELTADFSTAPDNAQYYRLTFFFDWQSAGTGTDVVSYFDDVVIGEGECFTVSTWQPIPVAAMQVQPNPVSDRLRVDNFKDVARMEVLNAFGQRVISQTTSGELRTFINVDNLPTGVYGLAGYTEQGVLVGNAKFVVQR